MNNFRKFLVGAATAGLMAGMATVASAQESTATADTSVTIIRAISVGKTADLSFGTIVRPAADGTVSLSTAGTVTGAVTVGAAATRTPAVFVVNGEGGQTYTINEVATLGAFTVTLVKAVSGGGTISTTAAGGTGVLSGTLGGAGTSTLTYGASFPITTETATGAYTGSLAVTVNYQ